MLSRLLDQYRKRVVVCTDSKGDKLWGYDKSKEAQKRNRSARQKLIELDGSVKIWAKLKDEYHRSKAVWGEVAYEMMKCGFNRPYLLTAQHTICRQKIRPDIEPGSVGANKCSMQMD